MKPRIVTFATSFAASLAVVGGISAYMGECLSSAMIGLLVGAAAVSALVFVTWVMP